MKKSLYGTENIQLKTEIYLIWSNYLIEEIGNNFLYLN